MSPTTRSELGRLIAVAVQEAHTTWAGEGLSNGARAWAGRMLEQCLRAWCDGPRDDAIQQGLRILEDAQRQDLPMPALIQTLATLPERLDRLQAGTNKLKQPLKDLESFIRQLFCEGSEQLWAQQQRQRRSLQAQSREIGALLNLARDFSHLKSLEDLPRLVLSRNARAFGCDRALAWSYHPTEGLSCIGSFAFERSEAHACLWIPHAERLATQCIEAQQPIWNNETDRSPIEASIHLPLISAGEVIGALSLYRKGPDASFHKRDLLLAQSLSSISSLLLSNARLITDYRLREERAARLAELSSQLAGVRPFKAMLDKAADYLREILVPDGMAVVKLRRSEPIECLRSEAISFTHPHWIPTEQACRLMCLAVDAEPFATLGRYQEPLILGDLSRYEVEGRRLSELTGAGSALLMPIIDDTHVIGALELLSAETDRFRNIDMALARSVTERISASLLGARLLDETERRAHEIETLFEAAQDISRQRPDLEGVMDRLLKRTMTLLKVDMGFVALIQGDQARFPASVLPAEAGLPPSFPLATHNHLLLEMLQQSRPVQLKKPQELVPETYPLLSRLRARSLLMVPMLLDDELIGGVVLASADERLFDQSERNLALNLAYLGALAVRTASYFSTLEQEVSSRTRALEDANKQLRMLDQVRRNLLANVTHELRTPLSGILGYGEILEEELSDQLTDEQCAFIRQLLSEGYHLRDLINTMLDMSQLATGTLELDRQPVSFALLARQACDQYTTLAEPQGVRFTCDCDANLSYVYADPSRAYQVLGHLLTNSLKFTPKGGAVSLRVTTEEDERPMLRVEVSDTGIGIEPEKLPMLFTSFYQADPSATRQFGGMGLGLSLAKQLVELHGGRIWATSTPGSGSTFSFTLPIWQETDETAMSEER